MTSSEEYVQSSEHEPDWIISHIIIAPQDSIDSYIKMPNRNNLPDRNENDAAESSDGKWEVFGRSFRINLQS